ncbi:MAG: helix-turn-helix domain-containing protein [Rikenellaceae bacterium]
MQYIVDVEHKRCLGFYFKEHASIAQHFWRLYNKEEIIDESITEWYSNDEIMEVHNMTKSAVYSMVSEHKVPKKKNGAITLYSKSHVDLLVKARRGDTSIESTYSTQDLFERYGLQPNYVRNFVYSNKIPRRREGGKTLYSQSHFDEAIKKQNPPTVYLLVEEVAELFNQTAKHIYYLIEKHDIPTIKIDARIRVQKVALDKIEDMECYPFVVFQRINVAIQDAKDYEEALNERCNLTYFDMPTTANMLQAYWIDYEVWFRESSAFKYRNWVERYLVMPPFTNHSDQEPENNTSSHPDHDEPTYEEVSECGN